jgi:hypothetical protein
MLRSRLPLPPCAALAAALVLLPLAAHAGTRGLVAVLPLDAREAKLTRATLSTIEEAVRTVAGDELTPHCYTVLTGETTLALLEDNGVDPGKACEASCALEAARHLKAKLFISGSVVTSEGEFVAFVRLFENETGRQLASVQLEAATAKELRRSFAAQAPAFFGKALGLAGTSAATSDDGPRTVAPPAAQTPAAKAKATGATVLFQLASADLDGTTVELVTPQGRHPCSNKIDFGIACSLRGVQPGKAEFALKAPDRDEVLVKADVSLFGAPKEISRRGHGETVLFAVAGVVTGVLGYYSLGKANGDMGSWYFSTGILLLGNSAVALTKGIYDAATQAADPTLEDVPQTKPRHEVPSQFATR